MRNLSILFFLLASHFNANSQSVAIDTSHHCIYTHTHFTDQPYIFSGDRSIEAIVDQICEAIGIEKDFDVLNASIPSIAAVVDDSGKYLLYSRRYAKKMLDENPGLLYTMLAHEIGHLVLGHELNDQFRLREEVGAMEFAGRVMYKLRNEEGLEKVINNLEQVNFAYKELLITGTRNLKVEALINGWNKEDNYLSSKENAGWFEDKNVRDKLPLPMFQIKGCPRNHLFDRTYFNSCQTLGKVDEMLAKGIYALGYEQLSYFYLPNGYAMLTAVEQIKKDGTPLSGAERWQDYPAGGRFEGILDYLSSVIFPKPGYFRLFAFLVADQNIPVENAELDGDEARAWLRNGGQMLPPSISQKPFTANHEIMILVYEFEVPETTMAMEEYCDILLTIQNHLNKSGIKRVFRP